VRDRCTLQDMAVLRMLVDTVYLIDTDQEGLPVDDRVWRVGYLQQIARLVDRNLAVDHHRPGRIRQRSARSEAQRHGNGGRFEEVSRMCCGVARPATRNLCHEVPLPCCPTVMLPARAPAPVSGACWHRYGRKASLFLWHECSKGRTLSLAFSRLPRAKPPRMS